jgi:hypothetical protein
VPHQEESTVPIREPAVGVVGAWFVIAIGVASLATAQEPSPAPLPVPAPAPAASDSFLPNRKPALEVTRATGPIRIDGDLDDPGWQQAARAGNFAEISPGDQTRPSVTTEVLIAYDEANLYLGFEAKDDPKAVRSSLRDRDQIFADDWIGIILDTYGDAAWAYEIFLNPIGIPGDLRWTPNGEDSSFDLVFESRGRVTDDGYRVEVAIPFASLRFPDRLEHVWRATFIRTRPRDSRCQYSWATINRDDPCFPCQFGTLTGIRDVRRSSKLTLLPSVTASQFGTLRDENDPTSGLDNSKVDAEVGLNLQYSFTSSLVADAALNPDFSQVETDAAQIDVNSTFALFYPERRPFFQEGYDLYDTYIDAVYTRSINDPLAAAKLTGRATRSSLGYIGAQDENTPIILPFEERSGLVAPGKSWSNIVRLKQTLLEDSFLGALVTDRRYHGGAGTVLGADGSLRFGKNYRLRAQALASHTIEPNDPTLTQDLVDEFVAEDSSLAFFDNGQHSVAWDGEQFWGHGVYAGFQRDARLWNLELNWNATSPTFRADNGFVTGNSRRQADAWTGLIFRPNNRVFDEITPSVTIARVWNFDGVQKDEWLRPQLYFRTKKQTGFTFAYLWSNELFHGIQFDGIHRWSGEIWSDYIESFKPGVWYQSGRTIARNIDVPVLGDSRELSLWATIKPIDRLVLQPSFDYSRLRYHDTTTDIFNGWILRARVNYQFTRELFLRLIVQYDDFDERLDFDPLLTYRLNPFTVFYLGSTHDFHEVGTTQELTQTERQFFLKLQYLFRI